MPKTTQSVQYAAQVAGAANFSSRIDDKRQVMGEVQTARIKVTIDAANAATDVITLLRLPPGAMVLPELSKIIVTDDCTSGALTIDICDIVDVDRYCDGANCASTGVVDFLTSAPLPDGLANPIPVAATGVSTTDTSVIIMTLATFTATIEAGEIYVILAYKCL